MGLGRGFAHAEGKSTGDKAQHDARRQDSRRHDAEAPRQRQGLQRGAKPTAAQAARDEPNGGASRGGPGERDQDGYGDGGRGGGHMHHAPRLQHRSDTPQASQPRRGLNRGKRASDGHNDSYGQDRRGGGGRGRGRGSAPKFQASTKTQQVKLDIVKIGGPSLPSDVDRKNPLADYLAGLRRVQKLASAVGRHGRSAVRGVTKIKDAKDHDASKGMWVGIAPSTMEAVPPGDKNLKHHRVFCVEGTAAVTGGEAVDKDNKVAIGAVLRDQVLYRNIAYVTNYVAKLLTVGSFVCPPVFKQFLSMWYAPTFEEAVSTDTDDTDPETIKERARAKEDDVRARARAHFEKCIVGTALDNDVSFRVTRSHMVSVQEDEHKVDHEVTDVFLRSENEDDCWPEGSREFADTLDAKTTEAETQAFLKKCVIISFTNTRGFFCEKATKLDREADKIEDELNDMVSRGEGEDKTDKKKEELRKGRRQALVARYGEAYAESHEPDMFAKHRWRTHLDKASGEEMDIYVNDDNWVFDDTYNEIGMMYNGEIVPCVHDALPPDAESDSAANDAEGWERISADDSTVYEMCFATWHAGDPDEWRGHVVFINAPMTKYSLELLCDQSDAKKAQPTCLHEYVHNTRAEYRKHWVESWPDALKLLRDTLHQIDVDAKAMGDDRSEWIPVVDSMRPIGYQLFREQTRMYAEVYEVGDDPVAASKAIEEAHHFSAELASMFSTFVPIELVVRMLFPYMSVKAPRGAGAVRRLPMIDVLNMLALVRKMNVLSGEFDGVVRDTRSAEGVDWHFADKSPIGDGEQSHRAARSFFCKPTSAAVFVLRMVGIVHELAKCVKLDLFQVETRAFEQNEAVRLLADPVRYPMFREVTLADDDYDKRSLIGAQRKHKEKLKEEGKE